jgi:hypothetical protein
VGHQLDGCDHLDMLEESAVTRRRVAVMLRGGTRFVDYVRDVVTDGGQNLAVFHDHGRVALDDILECRHVEPLESTYDHKL